MLLSRGDRVRKLNGKGEGLTGTVRTLYDGGIRALVDCDDSTVRWPVQYSQNFEVLAEERPPPIPAAPIAKNPRGKEPDEDTEGGGANLSDALRSLNLGAPAAPLWNALPSAHYPPEFTARTLIELPHFDVSSGRFHWAGREYSAAEWRAQLASWEHKYPNIVDRSNASNPRTLHETMSFRSEQTTSKEIVSWCWDSLERTNHHIATRFSDRFRVDMYGNVVSLEASDGALCSFDVDHLFPWSRGGRSVRANFAAVQHSANRTVKRDSLIQSLNSHDMLCGITPEQFASLMRHAEERAGGSRNRRDTQFEVDRAIGWLTRGPKRGFSISNFQTAVNRTNDGSRLWAFFEEHERNQIEGRASTAPVPAAAPEPSAATAAAPVSPPRAPLIYVRVCNRVVECFGPSTYMCRLQLRSLQMSWDGAEDRKCWSKLLGPEETAGAFVARLTRLLTTLGVGVEMA